tara:strand:+ start:263 stop:526 length:264 start_codon:yes stop_codon:yes gene_type:complete
MITKNEILEESRYFMGENNVFMRAKAPKRRDMLKKLAEKSLLNAFEERACLKRELKRRKIKFSNDDDNHTLVNTALKRGLNFNDFIL